MKYTWFLVDVTIQTQLLNLHGHNDSNQDEVGVRLTTKWPFSHAPLPPEDKIKRDEAVFFVLNAD